MADLGGFGAGFESEGGRKEGAPLGGYGGWKGGRARDGGRRGGGKSPRALETIPPARSQHRS